MLAQSHSYVTVQNISEHERTVRHVLLPEGRVLIPPGEAVVVPMAVYVSEIARHLWARNITGDAVAHRDALRTTVGVEREYQKCAFIKKNGAVCRLFVKAGSEYCGQHGAILLRREKEAKKEAKVK